jgi:hypothetical protein
VVDQGSDHTDLRIILARLHQSFEAIRGKYSVFIQDEHPIRVLVKRGLDPNVIVARITTILDKIDDLNHWKA